MLSFKLWLFFFSPLESVFCLTGGFGPTYLQSTSRPMNPPCDAGFLFCPLSFPFLSRPQASEASQPDPPFFFLKDMTNADSPAPDLYTKLLIPAAFFSFKAFRPLFLRPPRAVLIHEVRFEAKSPPWTAFLKQTGRLRGLRPTSFQSGSPPTRTI